MPGTPVAAEVLATAERQRREQLQQLRAQQQDAAAATGDMSAPPLRSTGVSTPDNSSSMRGLQQASAAGSTMKTPAAGTLSKSRLGASSGAGPAAAQPVAPGTASRAAAAGVFKTPAAKTPGSAATGDAAGTAGRAVLATPAPLTVAKTGSKGLRVSGSRADENQEPGSAGKKLMLAGRQAAVGGHQTLSVAQTDHRPRALNSPRIPFGLLGCCQPSCAVTRALWCQQSMTVLLLVWTELT